jgi:phosphatidylserine/phosphatidylglycerophosphate/cardiolipin synthase-like enzyme
MVDRRLDRLQPKVGCEYTVCGMVCSDAVQSEWLTQSRYLAAELSCAELVRHWSSEQSDTPQNSGCRWPDWFYWWGESGETLRGPTYFPMLSPVGALRSQKFSSSPTDGSESMELMYLMSITAAAKAIDLSAAYFVPDDLTRKALLAALKRGVKVRVIVTGQHIDSESVRLVSKAEWGELLAARIQISEFAPTMFHCKVMVVDSLLVSLGSTNFDNRSMRLNDEATFNVLDPELQRHRK